jgi:transcriptional regulator
LSLEPQHGWAISERIHQVSKETLLIPQGSLYPALHRLERRGWIKAEWGTSDNNRKAKYYALTRAGLKQLDSERAAWKQLTAAVALVLDTGL